MDYKVGQRFLINGEVYILAQSLPDTCCLININTGIRYGDKLEDFWRSVPKKSIDHLCNDADWKLLSI